MILKISFLLGDDYIDTIYWLWISKMKYMYFEIFDKLIKKYGSIRNVWALDYNELSQCEFLTNNQVAELCNYEYKKNLQVYIEYMEKNCIGVVNCYSEKYPGKLNFIRNKPILLFYKGNIDIANKEAVAIVGSRECSVYGRKCAEHFASEISKRGINVISGLALGIDSVAHITALNKHGNTIAVVGNGLDCVYPSQNFKLAQSIVNNNRTAYFGILYRNKAREK